MFLYVYMNICTSMYNFANAQFSTYPYDWPLDFRWLSSRGWLRLRRSWRRVQNKNTFALGCRNCSRLEPTKTFWKTMVNKNTQNLETLTLCRDLFVNKFNTLNERVYYSLHTSLSFGLKLHCKRHYSPLFAIAQSSSDLHSSVPHTRFPGLVHDTRASGRR